ncbi:hypothetical protein CHS0354_023996 [Potamilus streckersoni]|uniref:phosphoribosylamine--glycine ligase n=1 Tax=Potamilus streckersoni TaxID=2493646 RepID=A0AAE0VMS6_9BIVA|nr:hypothetical protein CHS0354_023996 [Potamilus streckersoni]
MKILIVGNGGREHALAWTLRKDFRVKKIYIAPGNGGTVFLRDIVQNIPISVNDIKGLVAFARQEHVDYVVVGPEFPLENGIVNAFRASNISIIGPTKEAAKLETSKAFAKSVMTAAKIPTACYKTFTNGFKAKDYVRSIKEFPIVIKASGIAAGKGVVIAYSLEDTEKALKEMFEEKIFGNAGNEVIIEEFMRGEEASVFALTDGIHYKLLSVAQDHKRIGEQDMGKNTGGMGAYAPTSIVNTNVLEQTKKSIIEPLLEEMTRRGTPFTGILYIGLMIENQIPKVVEFNARLGDPETQVVLPLLETSLNSIFESMITSQIEGTNVLLSNNSAATVVLASSGYPDQYEIGHNIVSLNDASIWERYSEIKNDVLVFHSGTKVERNRLLTSGGRVLSVTGISESLKKSLSLVYNKIKDVSFTNVYFRKDIGYRELGRTGIKEGIKE